MNKRFQNTTWQKSMRLKLDVNNMFAEQVGKEHGFTESDVDKMQDKAIETHKAIKTAEEGQFFYLYELSTAFIGELYNINAFNQPGVQLGKKYAYGILGREGFSDMKKEFASRPKKKENFIL
ncbi:hypothetical protein JCM16358_17890 [Halanaerocella petrolearia]